jgi:transcriptional regulator with XRE-family HTH domain
MQHYRERRKALGMTQTELAARLEISPGYLAHIEQGRVEPSPKLRRKLVSILAARTDGSDQPLLPGLGLDPVPPAETTDAIVAFLTRLDQRLARTHDPRARTALLDIDEAAERLRALVSA